MFLYKSILLSFAKADNSIRFNKEFSQDRSSASICACLARLNVPLCHLLNSVELYFCS